MARSRSLSRMPRSRNSCDDVVAHPTFGRERADLLGVVGEADVRTDVGHPVDWDPARVSAFQPAVGPAQPVAQPPCPDPREPGPGAREQGGDMRWLAGDEVVELDVVDVADL